MAEKGVVVLNLTNFDKYDLNKDFALPVRESIRSKLITNISSRDGKLFLNQTLEHYGKKPIAVLRDVEISPVSKADIERFAKEAGFSDIQFYGDWDLSPLTEKSDNIVALLR